MFPFKSNKLLFLYITMFPSKSNKWLYPDPFQVKQVTLSLYHNDPFQVKQVTLSLYYNVPFQVKQVTLSLYHNVPFQVKQVTLSLYHNDPFQVKQVSLSLYYNVPFQANLLFLMYHCSLSSQQVVFLYTHDVLSNKLSVLLSQWSLTKSAHSLWLQCFSSVTLSLYHNVPCQTSYNSLYNDPFQVKQVIWSQWSLSSQTYSFSISQWSLSSQTVSLSLYHNVPFQVKQVTLSLYHNDPFQVKQVSLSYTMNAFVKQVIFLYITLSLCKQDSFSISQWSLSSQITLSAHNDPFQVKQGIGIYIKCSKIKQVIFLYISDPFQVKQVSVSLSNSCLLYITMHSHCQVKQVICSLYHNHPFQVKQVIFLYITMIGVKSNKLSFSISQWSPFKSKQVNITMKSNKLL